MAGHETTSTTITWIFYELAKTPDIQDKLRSEILDRLRLKNERGEVDWTWKDFEEMPYLSAVLKVSVEWDLLCLCCDSPSFQEALRIHPVGPITFREALEDDVLPLSEPLVTESGEVITELAIPKGVKILASVAAYNRWILCFCKWLTTMLTFFFP